MRDKRILRVTQDDEKKRLDVFLTGVFCHSRSFFKKGILAGRVKVNGAIVKPNYNLQRNDKITIVFPEVSQPSLKPEDIPLDIIFEDQDIIVVNKPKGMVVYPAVGNHSGTLLNALLNHTKNLSVKSGPMRPGIVHRLDKDTSGAILIAKSDKAYKNISQQFKNRKIKKVYQTLVWGQIREDKATITAPIRRHPKQRVKMHVAAKGSREAITHFTVIERFNEFTFLEVVIETGRTHQIRVHMQYIGHPIAGDLLYSRRKTPFATMGQILHAYKLGFQHPDTDKYTEFVAPIPCDIITILDLLRNKKRGG